MERDFAKEIDALNRQMAELRSVVGICLEKEPFHAPLRSLFGKTKDEYDQIAAEMERGGKKIPDWADNLAQVALDKQYASGVVRSEGVFNSPADEGHMWHLDHSVDDLLNIDESISERVLTAIGNRTRIKILKHVLSHPCTASELVEDLDMNTTGKAYHHLNLLEKADLITKDDRGRYHFHGHRVSAFFSALSCVNEVIDTQYTRAHIYALPLRD